MLLLCSSLILGIFAGTQIAEAFLLVPYWKSLSADAFFELHQTYGKRIYQFFAPLTILATLFPLGTVVYSLWYTTGNIVLVTLLGISTLAFFSTYFLYFKSANQSFANRTLSNEALPKELARWGTWHWGRIVFECIAFFCVLLLLLGA